ncbi:nuclear transport factor 2 family protein [Pelagicoccus sp. SDUM812003]|uniref:nuclear transport factor 2 family protein n=1 Tax=Pelagicoccus sp. SDUM812003 TaxID=3041267 RepID=UPI00280F29F8|nr:nuclear transport factor 2 family protein [Pelagicoccus sp. SDUM812003]MDQ8205511.1 nuclear transport factor 2 family protein [Pelagicoccus sp. SDUM812003]
MTNTAVESRPPLPPFSLETAKAKVQAAEDAWNSRDPKKVSLAYTPDTVWRNRSEFLQGRDQVQAFLERKWQRELDYKLKKTLWAFTENRIAVTFIYEWRDDSNQWYRSHGNEMWEFAANGQMRRREASINDLRIQESERTLF